MAAKVVFHLPSQFLDSFLESPHLTLFQKIHEVVLSRGGQIEVRRRHEALRSADYTDCSEYLEADNLHIVENGMVQQANVLNTALAYLPPYFHLDVQGALAESSAGKAMYNSADVNAVRARSHFRSLQDRFVVPRRSRYGQKGGVADISEGCIAVFLQGDNPHRQGTAFCDNETLLRTVAQHAGDRKIVVKAHPMSKQLSDAQLVLKLLQEGLPIEPSDANVHDILSQCAVTVSYNSAVAIEGFLHGKPAVLFGKSDFHHVVETVRKPAEFPEALTAALGSHVDYAKYLHWYFSQFSVSAEDFTLEEKVLRIFDAAGFSAGRLGLQSTVASSDVRLEGPQSRQALSETQRLLRGLTQSNRLKLRRSLIVKEDYQEFLGSLGDQKVRVCRQFAKSADEDVRGCVAEANHLQRVLTSPRFSAEKVELSYEEFGLLCVTHAPGVSLTQKIAPSRGARRAKFVRMGMEWLQEATLERTRVIGLSSLLRLDVLKEQSLDNITKTEDRALLDDLLSDLTKRAQRLKAMEITLVRGQEWFSADNLIFKDGVLCATNIRSAHWVSLSGSVAQYLVDLQLVAPMGSDRTRFGIAQDDWRALQTIDLIPESEKRTALPFFVGEHVLRRFALDYHDTDLKGRSRQAIRSFLDRNFS